MHRTTSPDVALLDAPDPRPRFLSEAACHDIAQRLARYAVGGGYSGVTIVSTWRGNVRWARNQISTSGEVRAPIVQIGRRVAGAEAATVRINETTDEALVAAERRAERLLKLKQEQGRDELLTTFSKEPSPAPNLFIDATYQMDAGRRAEAARQLIRSATEAGMLSAGYIEVSAHSQAVITSWGYANFFQYTWARYSVTVRDPKGTGSGWAGVDWPDWNKIDGEKLSAIALDKCFKSRNPVAIEPGRYTTILEPQAVADFVNLAFGDGIWGRRVFYLDIDESKPGEPFDITARGVRYRGGGFEYRGETLLGKKVVDERISIWADPMDPDLGFPTIEPGSNPLYSLNVGARVFHPATWIEHGVWTGTAYDRGNIGRNKTPPSRLNSGAFRMSGGETSVEEMIANTQRGLLVTRFDRLEPVDYKSTLCRGYTRDGLWLIENGKISKAVKNMAFTESVLVALNNVEQLGPPQRVFHPQIYDPFELPHPEIVPPLKVRDFSFTALIDAV